MFFYMSYSCELEDKLKVKDFIDVLEQKFDNSRYFKESRSSLNQLRSMKLFLYRDWSEWRLCSQGTLLDSTDCLTLSVITHLLASRKGIDTIVVRPKKISRYFHAMLSYDFGEGKNIFKIAGSNNKYGCVPLKESQIQRRIKYTRPFVNFVNSIRFGKEVYFKFPN